VDRHHFFSVYIACYIACNLFFSLSLCMSSRVDEHGFLPVAGCLFQIFFSPDMTQERTGTEACRWNCLVERPFLSRVAGQNTWMEISVSGSSLTGDDSE